MYEFAVDIPENISNRSYGDPERIISKQKMYIPIITFNADSSEMGDYVSKIQSNMIKGEFKRRGKQIYSWPH